jgi:hypothetical protein
VEGAFRGEKVRGGDGGPVGARHEMEEGEGGGDWAKAREEAEDDDAQDGEAGEGAGYNRCDTSKKPNIDQQGHLCDEKRRKEESTNSHRSTSQPAQGCYERQANSGQTGSRQSLSFSTGIPSLAIEEKSTKRSDNEW